MDENQKSMSDYLEVLSWLKDELKQSLAEENQDDHIEYLENQAALALASVGFAISKYNLHPQMKKSEMEL